MRTRFTRLTYTVSTVVAQTLDARWRRDGPGQPHRDGAGASARRGMIQLGSVSMWSRQLTPSLLCWACMSTVGSELQYQTRPKSCKRLRRTDTVVHLGSPWFLEVFQIPERRQAGQELDHQALISVPVASLHQSKSCADLGLVGPGTRRIFTMDMVCEHPVSRALRACCGCVYLGVFACRRLGQGRPQREISNVTLVLGQLQMAAAEKEGKEDCGDSKPMPVISWWLGSGEKGIGISRPASRTLAPTICYGPGTLPSHLLALVP